MRRLLFLLPLLFACSVKEPVVMCYRADLCYIYGGASGYCLYSVFEDRSQRRVTAFYSREALIDYVQSKELQTCE